MILIVDRLSESKSMKPLKLVLIISALFISSNSIASWTPESIVSYVRTYDGVNYSIGLKDFRCVKKNRVREQLFLILESKTDQWGQTHCCPSKL